MRLGVLEGMSEARDPLPAELAAGPVRAIAYRVQLRNSLGRTAGPSAAVFVAAGAAPAAVEGFQGSAAKVGAVLEWRAGVGGADVVELERVTVEAQGGAGVGVAASEGADTRVGAATGAGVVPNARRRGVSQRKKGATSERTQNAATRFRAGGTGDAGGTIDRTAKIGETYLYTATRVRTAIVDGRSLEVRSSPSLSVRVEMRDVFPPEAPVGLVASPGFVRGPGGQPERPAIDLSWEPSAETRVVGYRVYRRVGDVGAWALLGEMVSVPAYRDETVEAGTRYAYRVTAVDGAGHESGASSQVMETGPGQ